jgi:transposase InsO family protein
MASFSAALALAAAGRQSRRPAGCTQRAGWAGPQARFLIRDRGGKFPNLFDAVLKDAGIEIVLSGVQMPRMNAVMERWVQTCRRELLDRTLIWNQRHLLYALREFEQFYNAHRPHQGIANARPLSALPPRSQNWPPTPTFTSADATASAVSSTSTGTPLNLHG